ncbi:extracellular solute-binding protein [Paenibacillus sp. GD4]|jgi:putative aldouronate transport system substrate-binding protein|uniref:extracellular solute-binding protein n=1 Tax=Paenibacillus sp. GD4 TaxID=3068890 RepID=UPI002796DB27|nr:extracellular solute-binding protein [Paenibacillus sp. GD4]MDQ1910331.1 extracellular solute-binding protein [Paenibacillus sp. GD4]
MKKVKKRALVSTVVVSSMLFTVACSSGGESKAPAAGQQGQNQSQNQAPLDLSIAISQVGDIPSKGNPVEQAIEKFTNTKLDIQWIPSSAYNDKINVMLASNEMPKLLRVTQGPTIVNAIESQLFWEIGPYLKEYKNLSAQNPQFFENISVEGKLYGVPLYRNMGRGAVVYRKDWMDNLKLAYPKTVDEWYNVMKALTQNDPDKNGKNDTYGIILHKKYNEGAASMTTRFAVMLGGVNKWGVDKDGNFTPEYTTPEFMETLKLFRRLYAENLMNQDFAVLDAAEAEKWMDTGRVGFRFGVATNGKSQQDRLNKTNPSAVIDVASFEGPKGIRIASENGNNGFFVIPKSSVKTEAEMKRVLGFLDKLMEPEMSTLLLRGIEGTHFGNTADGKTEFIGDGFNIFQREVKPYRDNLTVLEGYNVKPLKDVPIGEKGTKMESDGIKYIVSNPALTLKSPTYSERGQELDLQMMDAQTKFIMGKIDEAGYQEEVNKWKKNGGDKVMAEYKAAYQKLKK